MQRAGVLDLPLYPEERTCQRPAAEQVFRLFALPARHVLTVAGQNVRVIDPELTAMQGQVLRLMGIPQSVYATRS